MPNFSRIINRNDAGPLINEDVYPEIWKAIGDTSVVMRTFRRLRDMPTNQTRMPVIGSFPEAYFVNTDTGLKRTTEMDWNNVFINAEEVAVIVPIPENVLDDASYDLWAECRPELVTAIAQAVDEAVFFGTNAPAAWPVDVAAAALAAGNNVALGAGVDTYQDILGVAGVIAQLEADGYTPTGHVASTGLRSILRDVRALTGELIFQGSMQEGGNYRLDGSPMDFPKYAAFQAANSGIHMFSGQWDQFVYAIRKDITFKLATEASIHGPDGAVRYNLFQQDMVALRVTFRMGWQCPNPINRLQPNPALRYPAAILTV